MQKRLLLVAVVAIVMVVVGVVLYRSPMFTIKNIEIVGIQHASEAELLREAAVPTGTTLPAVDTSAIEKRLRENPWVASVDVKRHLPSTLRIEVQERTPVALVDDGTAFWYIDGTAMVLGESAPETQSAIPVIRDVPGYSGVPGTVRDIEPLTNALVAIASMPDELKTIVRGISAPSVDETTLVTDSGVEIRIGDATEDLERKAGIALSILADKGDSVVYIDVRSVQNPISRGL